jgi:hypothetical protein
MEAAYSGTTMAVEKAELEKLLEYVDELRTDGKLSIRDDTTTTNTTTGFATTNTTAALMHHLIETIPTSAGTETNRCRLLQQLMDFERFRAYIDDIMAVGKYPHVDPNIANEMNPLTMGNGQSEQRLAYFVAPKSLLEKFGPQTFEEAAADRKAAGIQV